MCKFSITMVFYMKEKSIIETSATAGEVQECRNGEYFVKMYQSGLLRLAGLRLTGETYSVLLYLCGKLTFNNWIAVTQASIGKDLNIVQQNVSLAMKVLLENGIIEAGPKTGRCNTYRLNPALGFKGDEGRAARDGLRVLEGGKSKAKPSQLQPSKRGRSHKPCNSCMFC